MQHGADPPHHGLGTTNVIEVKVRENKQIDVRDLEKFKTLT